MDTYHVFWLLDELKVLVQNGVINEETARRMADYYAGLTDSARPSAAVSPLPAEGPAAAGGVPLGTPSGDGISVDGAPAVPTAAEGDSVRPSAARSRSNRRKPARNLFPAFSVASIPVLLSVIAAVLIAAGVISLAAYNWNVIPRTVKALFAFVLLLVVQAGGVFVSVREGLFSRAAWREGTSVLWSLMFGGVVAFISQICRLPGDTASFLLVWSVSSILLTYAMQSVGAFVISLLLASSYAFLSSGTGGPVSLFCLLFASLCPFALRFKYGRHVMLAVAAVMLNVVMDHSIPGLWAVCSVSFAVLCLEYGMSCGSRGITFLSAAGLCVLLLVLSVNQLWDNTGWDSLRGDCSVWGIVFDCLLAAGLVALSIVWQFVPRLRGKPFPAWKLAYPLCSLAVCGLFIAYGCIPEGLSRKLYLAPTAMVFLFSVLFLVHTLYSRRKYSVFLFCFLFVSACITQLNLPVLAVAAFLLLLAAMGTYRGSLIRAALYAVLLVSTACLALDPSPSWHGAVLFHCALFKPQALPFQLVLYSLYLMAAVCLFARSRAFAKSVDIVAVCIAVGLLSVLGLAFPLGKDVICMVYFCLLLFACSWHVAGAGGGERRGLSFYVLPFAALAVYFFWSAALVMQLNCPVLSVSAFILLFEAVGRYWAGRNEKPGACGNGNAGLNEKAESGRSENAERNEKAGRVAYAISRVLMAVWMPCVVLLLQEGTAFAVYEQGAMPFQMLSCLFIALAAFVLLFVSKKWKDSLDLLLLLAALLGFAAFLWRTDGPEVKENSLYAFLYIFTLAGLYGYVKFRCCNRSAYIPYLLMFVLVTVANLYHTTGTWFLCPPVMPLLSALYVVAKERNGGTVRHGASGTGALWGILAAAMVFASAFAGGSFYHARSLGLPQLVPVCVSLLAYVSMSLLPAIRLIRKKRLFNYAFALHSLIVSAFLFTILLAGVSGNDPLATLLDKAMSFCSFACIFLVAGYFIYEAYMERSLAKANVAACYAALALVIKFFSDDYGFVAKGVLFIVLGVAMLLLNLLLYRLERKKKIAGEVTNEIDG